ncbi:hypothetical protein J6590_040516 [Homalodisca vitripennis]|nr:hypothetical protein J6590_040516 [Homalodisca vitripennis]
MALKKHLLQRMTVAGVLGSTIVVCKRISVITQSLVRLNDSQFFSYHLRVYSDPHHCPIRALVPWSNQCRIQLQLQEDSMCVL